LALALGGVALLVVGCLRGSPSERPPIHLNPNMDDQPKYLPQSESAFFADGRTMRPAVPGTVARGELAADTAYHQGRVGEALVRGIPLPAVDDAVLRRGAERYAIFCGPCHGERGDGKGMLFVRSQVQSANLAEERIVAMPDGQLFETISRGFGLMPAYGHQIPVADRWAIVAHVRVLQDVEPVMQTTDVGEAPASGLAGGAEDGP
jgi:mono/diheme cytochrome c family protein